MGWRKWDNIWWQVLDSCVLGGGVPRVRGSLGQSWNCPWNISTAPYPPGVPSVVQIHTPCHFLTSGYDSYFRKWERQRLDCAAESSMCLHPRPISDTACNGQSIMRVVASFTKLFTVIFKAGFWPRALSADLIMRAETVSLNSCIRLFASSMDCSPPGSSVHGILQARILELAAFPFSRGSSPPRHWTWVSCFAGRFFTIWATREAPNLIILTFTITLFKVLCYVLNCFSHVQLFLTLKTVAHQLFCPWDSPGKDTGVGCHALLQGISISGVRWHLFFRHCCSRCKPVLE